MIARTPHHIEMLLREFAKRKETNPRYSLRAFARFLDMSSATLSRVLANRQEISLSASKKIIKKLNFSEHESLVFVRSIAEEKCNRAYQVLACNIEANAPFPHERNLTFIFNLNHECIYLNDMAAKLEKEFCNKNAAEVMATIGFDDHATEFIEDCLERVIVESRSIKHNLPIETSIGKLVIESIFSPLLNEGGKVSAVVSTLLNLNLEVIREADTEF